MTTTTIAAAQAAWQAALAHFEGVPANHPDATDEKGDALWAEWDRIVQIPTADPADILIKLAMIKERYVDEDWATPEVDHDAVVADIKATIGLPRQLAGMMDVAHQLVAVVEFYADEQRWKPTSAGITPAMDDRGHRAREILQQMRA